MRTAFLALTVAVLAACTGGGHAAYPERPAGCPVRSFPGEPNIAVDDLGSVSLDCAAGSRSCERQLLDGVCAVGGDVAWGLGDNDLTAAHLTAHAAHSHEVSLEVRERGCAVRTFSEAPSIGTRNIGPVTATCDADDSEEVCLRELEDQVCLLGGDVLWQIDGPTPKDGKQRMYGRAARSRP